MNKILKYILLCVLFCAQMVTSYAQEELAGNVDMASFISKKAKKETALPKKTAEPNPVVPLCDTVLEYRIKNITSTTITLEWKHTGHYKDTKYKFFWNTVNNPSPLNHETAWINTSCVSDCPQSFTLQGLLPNTAYNFYIYSQCDFSIPNTLSYADYKPLSNNLKLTATTPKKCDFSNGNFSIETDYKELRVVPSGFVGNIGDKLAEVELSQSGTNNLLSTTTGDVKTHNLATFSNLQACQLYDIRARAKCKNTDGTYSLGDWQNFPTKTKCCGEISWVSPPVATFNSITVKWYRSIYAPEQLFKLTIVDSKYNSHDIYVQPSMISNSTQYPIETYTFNNLIENERYNIYVTPFCDCAAYATTAATCTTSGGAIDVVATTANACALPKSVKITNLQSNQLTVNLETVATPKTRRYTINVYEATNVNQPIATKQLIANPNSDIELRADFYGLLGGTAYKVIVETECCLYANPNDPTDCNWGAAVTDNNQEQSITTPTVTCTGIGVVQASDVGSNKSTITWTIVAGRNYQVQLRKANFVERDTIIEGDGQSIAYTYYGLNPLTDYSVKVVTLCCQSTNTPCSKWSPGEDATVSFKTNFVISPDCIANPTTFTITPEADKIIISWETSTPAAALSPTGRRFIVKYGGSPIQTRIISDPADATINGLTPSTKYSVKIQEVFDGSYENFTTACEIVEQNVKTLDPPTTCDPSFSASFSCIGERYMVFQITQSADKKDNNIRIYYRPVPTTENCDQVQVVSSASVADITTTFMNKVFAGEEFYYLTELQPCTAYEVYFETYKRNINGVEEPCQKISMPQWYLTKRSSSVAIVDSDEDGFPDACDPVNTPKPKPKRVFDLKDLICGDKIDPINLTTLVPHTNGENDEVWTINGFPFKVDSIDKIGPNQYKGTGSMSLPFNKNKRLNIEFDNISVVKGATSGTFYVSAGTIRGVKDGVIDLPKLIQDINDKQKDAYKKFCQEPGYESGSSVNSNTGEKWNERGFCQDGSYCKNPPYSGYINPTNYDRRRDPMGFDKDGNHVNGTKYDDCGCDAYGNPEPQSGKSCTPKCKANYYWMAPDPTPTSEGQAYFSKVKNDLEAKIKAILAAKLITVDADLSIAVGKCDAEVAKMDAARATLEYPDTDKSLIYGPNNSWIRTGMHKLFSRTPVVFKEMNTRKTGQDALEIAHNQLYLADKDRTKLTYEKDIVTGLMSDASIKNLADAFGKILMSLDNTALSDIKKDADHPTAWLKTKIDAQIAYEYSLKEKTGAIDLNDDGTRLADKTMREHTVLATKDKAPLQQMLQEDNAENIKNQWEKQLRFEFEQGWQTVGGVDRALILEEINKQRLFTNYFATVASTEGVGEPYPVLTDKSGRIQAVYIDDFTFTTTDASANFYAVVETGRTQQIVFKAQGFKFNASGLTGPIYLGLASNVKIPMNNALMLTLKGEIASSTTEPTNGTFVKFSCENGFEGLQIDTDIEICDKYVLPLVDNGSGGYSIDATNGKYVKISTKAFFGSFNDILFTIKVSPFALAKYDDFKFVFKKDIVIDFSDIRTPKEVTFPSNYLVEDVKLWRGLYIPEVDIILPAKLFKSKDGKPKTAFAKDFIFDGGGFTGLFGVKDLIKPNEGTLGGWSFSVTDLQMQVKRNKPVGGGFGGEIHIPIFKEGQNLKYTARVMPNNEYEFAVSPTTDDPNKKFEVDLWLAKVDLAKTSFVKIAYIQDELSATANLDGTISISNDSEGGGKSKMGIDGITFEGLTLATGEKPIKDVGTWGVPKLEAKVGGFTFFLDKVALQKIKEKEKVNGVDTDVEKTALHFIVGFELVGDKNKGFNIGATGDFDLIGKVEVDANKDQKWKYDRLRMNALEVHAKTKGFSLDGKIVFFGPNSTIQAPKYGKGFYGYIAVSFEGMSIEKNPETKMKEKDTYGIEALAIFGRKEDDVTKEEYKYFLVDLMVMLGKGVDVGGGLRLKAAGGGISWHMERETMSNNQFAFQKKDIRTLALGTSISGFTYKPNNTTGLGIRLMVALAAVKEKAFSANAQFEITFNVGGGIKVIRFDGLAKFMQEPTIASPPEVTTPGKPMTVPSVNGVMAGLSMEYLVQEREFHATLDVYANLAGGLIKGCAGDPSCGAPYKVGTAEIYMSPKDWYINIGRPTSNPDEFVSIGVGIGSNNLVIETYFNIGTKIPSLPKLPEKALQILGDKFKPIDEGLRSTGKGIAFGARFAFQVKHDGFWVDVEAEAGLGFDVMMADYGETKCRKYSSYLPGGMGVGSYTDKQIGIGGWYATGQVFGYMAAKVSLFGKPIADIGGAAVLQFSGPNPMYIQGDIVATVKGKEKKFHIDKGERCDVVNSNGSTTPPIEQAKVISTITPADLTTKVNRFSNVEIAFEVPVEREFSYKDLGGNEIKMKTGTPVITISSDSRTFSENEYVKSWNPEKTRLTLSMNSPLPADANITVKVDLNVYKGGQAQTPDTKTVKFTTDEAWKNIPKENIISSYPADGMANFYKGQEDKGWVALNNDQSELISSSDDLEPRVRFFVSASATKKMVAEVPFVYNSVTKTIEFTMPSDKLASGGVYKMQLALINPIIEKSSGTNGAYLSGNVDNGVTPNIELLDIYFRVSNFATFGAKMKAASFPVTKNALSPYDLTIDMNVYEGFDDYETGNVEGQMPLILVQDELKTTSWYTTYAIPSVYNAYPECKPAVLPGDEFLTLGNEGSSVMPRVTKDYFDRNNYALNGYPKGRIEFNKYQKVRDVIDEIGKKNAQNHDACLSACDFMGDWYDAANGIMNYASDCKLGCQLYPPPTFMAPPTSTKLTFKYLLPASFVKQDSQSGTTTGRNNNNVSTNSVPSSAVEKSTFEVTVTH